MCIPALGHQLCAEPCASPASEYLKAFWGQFCSQGREGSILHHWAGRQLAFDALPNQLLIAVAVTVTYSKHVQTFLPSVVRAEFPANLACEINLFYLLLKTAQDIWLKSVHLLIRQFNVVLQSCWSFFFAGGQYIRAFLISPLWAEESLQDFSN